MKSTSRSSSRASSPTTSVKHDGFDVKQFFRSLEPLTLEVPFMSKLNRSEILELEEALEFRETNDRWKPDWSGNLDFTSKNVANPHTKTGGKKTFRQSFLDWAKNNPNTLRMLKNLLRHVCTETSVPNSLKKILGTIDESTSIDDVASLVRRASYDPDVLKEDGWIVEKSAQPIGSTGGPFLIGDHTRTENTDAVIIAYIHDSDIGDLWKVMWTDDLMTFDMEYEELSQAKKRWERFYEYPEARLKRAAKSNGASKDFTVDGIQYGVVIAASPTKGSRPGVYWPARVMHASEGGESTTGRRTLAKQKIEVVFLAPYWKSDDIIAPRVRRPEVMSENGAFDALPLLQVETLEASADTIKAFPLPISDAVDLKQLQVSFRFTGLPGSAFKRYLHAFRIAMALRLYAKECLQSKFKKYDEATAGLFDTHMLSVATPVFPNVVLNLPFSYIISQLPAANERASIGGAAAGTENESEPVICLSRVIEVLKSPFHSPGVPHEAKSQPQPHPSTTKEKTAWVRKAVGKEALPVVTIDNDNKDPMNDLLRGFMTTFPALNDTFNMYERSPPLVGLINCFTKMIDDLAAEDGLVEAERGKRSAIVTQRLKQDFIDSWVMLKTMGEEALASISARNFAQVSVEWRKACGRIYNFILQLFTDNKTGKGFSIIISDSRCNEHVTTSGCFERNVRIPAAMKGARLAVSSFPVGDKSAAKQGIMVQSVPDKYVKFVEERLLPKAHDSLYLAKMKARCAGPVDEEDGSILLTEDSEGEGGEDTGEFLVLVCLSVVSILTRSWISRNMESCRSWGCNRCCCGRQNTHGRVHQRVLCHSASWPSRWT